jgi:hypothetical protein
VEFGTEMPVRTRVGAVGAYVGQANVALVRRLRARVGHVTVSGRTGLGLIQALAKDGDLANVDLDPAGYLRKPKAQLELIPEDWSDCQRRLGLDVVRSKGRHVPTRDHAALHLAMTEPVGRNVVRVVSLHRSWLRPADFVHLLDAVDSCDDDLAFVFADVMDPFSSKVAVNALRDLVNRATSGGRRLELLRTDITGLAVATEGATLGAIGLSTSGRHHGLGMSAAQSEQWRHRQTWPLVYVPDLASWHRASTLGSLSAYGGAGITDCSCEPCAGRSLLRFDHSWDRIPPEVREDAQAHDVASWSALAGRILSSTDAAVMWAKVCADAVALAGGIASEYKVVFDLPRTIRSWAG